MLLQPGQHLGQYEIKRFLANGGMAEVYLATMPVLNRDVAIKVLYPHLAADEVFVTRFRREGQALAALEHRHIAGVLDTDTANGMHYLVMTYLPGGTLGALLKRTQDAGEILPVDKALEIIRQIASALEYAHSKGIVHRDLKPGNVLIAEDGRFVLSDFGLAQAQTSTRLTRTSTIMGTAEYMSPEQALGKELDLRSDIYSLGVILYELLAGKPPYTSSDPMSLMYKHVHEAPPPLTQHRANLPANLMTVVEKAMAKLPQNRYQTVGEFVAALNNQRAAAPSPKRAVPTTLLAIGGAAVALILGGGILLFANINRNSNGIDNGAGRGNLTQSPIIITTLPTATLAPIATTVQPSIAPGGVASPAPSVTPLPNNIAVPTLNAPTLAPSAPTATTTPSLATPLPAPATAAAPAQTATRLPPTATRVPPTPLPTATRVPPTAAPPPTATPLPPPTSPPPTSPPAPQPTSPPAQQPTSPPAEPTKPRATRAFQEVIHE